MMNFIKIVGAVLVLAATGSFAYADSRIFTASVDNKGQVIAQSPPVAERGKVNFAACLLLGVQSPLCAGVFKQRRVLQCLCHRCKLQ